MKHGCSRIVTDYRETFLDYLFWRKKEIIDAWMLVYHYRCHGNGSHIFGPKIIKNVMKKHLFCIIVSSRLKIVGLWSFFILNHCSVWILLRANNFSSPWFHSCSSEVGRVTRYWNLSFFIILTIAYHKPQVVWHSWAYEQPSTILDIW